MVMPICIAIALCFLSEGTGHCFLKVLHLKKNGFTAPIGVAILFAALEIFYLPRLCLGGPFGWIKGSTILVLIAAVVGCIYCLKDICKTMVRARSIYVLLACALMFALFYICKTNLAVDSDPELLLMAKNMNSESIMLENSRLQGYEMFGSFIIWLFNGDFEKAALTLALFSTMISVMLGLNIIDSFDIGNPWFRFTLVVSSIFYTPFYAWKITGAFHGGNWRVLFIALAIFTLYEWIRHKEENIKYMFPIVIAAGMFSHNGFLMIGIDLVYLSAVYLFHSKKIRSLYDVTTFCIPIVIYIAAWLSKYSMLACAVVLVIALAFYVLRLKRSVYLKIIRIEDVLIDHSYKIFYIAIPLIFLIGTFILRFFTTRYGIPYSEYIHFFSRKGIGTYLFLSNNVLDIVLDIFRWAGMIVFLLRASKPEEKMIRMLFLGMVIFFINPLCMGMFAQITGLEMYAHAFEIIFNPFTDIMIFYWIYKQFEWTVIGQWVLELTLLITCIFGHVSSFTNHSVGLYTDLIARDTTSGKVILP